MAWSAAKHTFDAVQDVEEDRDVEITTTARPDSAFGVWSSGAGRGGSLPRSALRSQTRSWRW
jgi:hypothetical protein